MIKSKFEYYYASILIFLVPYIEFLYSNLDRVDIFVLNTLFKSILILLALNVVISFLLGFFIKKISISNFVYLNSLSFFIIFFYLKIKSSLEILFKNFNFHFLGELSLIIIFFLIFFCYFLFIKKKFIIFKLLNVYSFIIFLLYFSLSASSLIFLFTNSKNNNQVANSNFELNNYLSLDEKSEKKILKENIYYVLTDAAIPLEDYSKYFSKLNVNEIKQFYEKNGFKYIENTRSSYNGTHLTLSQIFHLDYLINETSDRYNTSNIFPGIITNFNNLNLGKILEKLSYKFLWEGNVVVNCKNYLPNSCINNGIDRFSINYYINEFLINYTLVNFFSKSPLIDTANKIISIYKSNNSSRNLAFKENNAIKKFINKKNFLDINKKAFYFIHHLNPHGYAVPKYDPLVYNEDCTLKSIPTEEINYLKSLDIKWGGEQYGYDTNYKCFLKMVNEFIMFVNEYDPKAQVVIQSDHGITRKEDKYTVLKNFTLVKVNNNCQKYLTSEIDNVNAIRLLVGCATGLEPKLLPKKTYYEEKLLSPDNPLYQRVIELDNKY